MVIGIAYALNAHSTTHTEPYDHEHHHRNSLSSKEINCQSSGGCGSGYGRDVRAGVSCSNHIDSHGNSLDVMSVASKSSLDALFATPQQKRLAEITEMIHTASLFHDDVIDKVNTMLNIVVSSAAAGLPACLVRQQQQSRRHLQHNPHCASYSLL